MKNYKDYLALMDEIQVANECFEDLDISLQTTSPGKGILFNKGKRLREDTYSNLSNFLVDFINQYRESKDNL